MEPDYTVRVPSSGWLNANQRQHWTARSDLTAAWRRAAAWCARSARVPSLGQSRVVAELCMVPRRRVRIDPANYAPTAKAAVDGLVDAGIWPDDSSGWVIGPDMRLGPAAKTASEEALVLHIYGQPCCDGADHHHQEAGA